MSTSQSLTHYIIVRRDIPVGHAVAQVTHAAGESFFQVDRTYDPSGTTAVVLGARDEARLAKLERKLLKASIPHVAIRESDPPYSGQLMAIGLVPTQRELVKPIVKDFIPYPHIETSPSSLDVQLASPASLPLEQAQADSIRNHRLTV